MSKLHRVIKADRFQSEQLTDHNNIMRQIMLGYFFRIIRMILVIFTISYFIGTLWYIMCYQLHKKIDKRTDAKGQIINVDDFIVKFNFEEGKNPRTDFDR